MASQREDEEGHSIPRCSPQKFVYALKQWSVELRAKGWYVTSTESTIVSGAQQCGGPFQSAEAACRFIAKLLLEELKGQHAKDTELDKLQPGTLLYGFKRKSRSPAPWNP